MCCVFVCGGQPQPAARISSSLPQPREECSAIDPWVAVKIWHIARERGVNLDIIVQNCWF